MANDKEERANVYSIPKDMVASMQFMGFLTLTDIGYLGGILLLGMFISNLLQVQGILFLLVILFHFVIGIICIHRPYTNPDRRFISVLFTVLKDQDKENYKAIDKHYYNNQKGAEEDGIN